MLGFFCSQSVFQFKSPLQDHRFPFQMKRTCI